MPALGREPGPGPELDISLLAGFSFACRPDCGLCCFAAPRLEGDDEARLRSAAPTAHLEGGAGGRRVAAHANGGACTLLRRLRCSVHAARPAPCREFPVSVHIGTRLQASLVLSCPGLSLGPIPLFGSGILPPPFSGLDSEIKSVRERITPAVERTLRDAERRRRRVVRVLSESGRWVDESEVRGRLRKERLTPAADEYLPDELPSADQGLDRLPIFFDGRPGPVALAESAGGWEALELSPDGGARSVGLAVPPDDPPSLLPEAERLLEGYLRYWLARDCFLAAVHQDMLAAPGGDAVEATLDELHAIASDVLARGAVRVRLGGEAGARLSGTDVERGIRATDQDWLDRATWGSRL